MKQTNNKNESESQLEQLKQNGQVFSEMKYFVTPEHHNGIETNDDFISAYLFNGSIHVEKTDEKDINFKTICHIDPRSVRNFIITEDHKFLVMELI